MDMDQVRSVDRRATMNEFSKLFTQVAVMDTEGNQTGIDIVEVSTDDVVKAALGDTVLYAVTDENEREEVDFALASDELVQVYPEEDSE